MAISVKLVANSFLQADFNSGSKSISPMKIQKLVYLTHGWHLAIHEEPAIDGFFEAWPYGPVEDELYHVFKEYGSSPIKDYAKSWDGTAFKAFVVSDTNSKFQQVFDQVLKKYMRFSALQLSALTHQPGTPWSITRNTGGGIIPNELIQTHFQELARSV